MSKMQARTGGKLLISSNMVIGRNEWTTRTARAYSGFEGAIFRSRERPSFGSELFGVGRCLSSLAGMRGAQELSDTT